MASPSLDWGPMPTTASRDLAPLVVIGGPTATGKTALAITLAERLIAGGRLAEVISADSRQVYRGLDIGTAKATAEERARVVHHGLDLVDPDQPFSVAEFRAHALAALASLGARGGVGILAGGTGFWLRAVTAGLDTDALPSDTAVRAAIEHNLVDDGLDALADRLTATAPNLAARTDLRNPRRVVRALEIATLRGDAPLPGVVGYPAPVLGLQLALEPAEHRRRIALRARGQFDNGLVEEARALRERYDPGLQAFSAIGYRESWAVLDGELELDAAVELNSQRNAQFARRQRTWFRREPSLEVHRRRRGSDAHRRRSPGPLRRPAGAHTARRYPDDAMSPRQTIDLAPPVEKAFLVAVDTGDDEGWSADDSLTELAALARHGGRGRRRRRVAEPPSHRPELVRGQGQSRGAGPGALGDRLRRWSSPTTS